MGTPFNLEAGKHILSVRFRNGFGGNPLDHRCLYLAKYELLCLDQVAAPVLAANGSAPMLQQAATMQAEAAPAPIVQQAAAMRSQTPAPVMQQAATMQANAQPNATMQDIPLPGVFHVVFADALDGQIITGPVQIQAQCWMPNSDHAAPPTVDLVVNGKVIASQSFGPA